MYNDQTKQHHQDSIAHNFSASDHIHIVEGDRGTKGF